MTATSTPASSLDFGRATLAQALYKALETVTDFQIPAAITPQLFYTALERPPEAHLGDYALPCFRLAKDLKRKPPEIAAGLAAALPNVNPEWIEKVETAGAFLNITLRPAALARLLVPQLRENAYFKPLQATERPRVMIEYSQPNTHKVFHVGHMRNVALGDALGRIYKGCGYPVVMVNYIGDEGTHIAKCLWYIHKNKIKAPAENQGEWLGEMYSKATMALEDASPEELPALNAEVSAVLRAIESKQGEIFEEWKATREWSLKDFDAIYQWVNAHFDHFFYESDVSEESQKIVDEYRHSVFAESDGAIGLDLKEEKLGFVIVRKRDGNTTYATKDLALAQVKYRQYQIKKSIYVVASEQNLHFKQVFRTLEKMGFEEAKDCFHLSYGMVVLPDGKMSSRKGNIIKFRDLRESMEKEILETHLSKYKGVWSEEEIADACRKLCVGSIRYGMICSDPHKDIVFNLADWVAPEGNTGPYVMYAYARTRSILRKGEEQGYKPDEKHLELLNGPDERELLRYLNDLNGVITQTVEQNKPSLLCHHIYNTCKTYNRFLAQVMVLRAESDEARSARLALLEAMSVALKHSLNLLGLEPPERM